MFMVFPFSLVVLQWIHFTNPKIEREDVKMDNIIQPVEQLHGHRTE
jgi:hypothetical protein